MVLKEGKETSGEVGDDMDGSGKCLSDMMRLSLVYEELRMLWTGIVRSISLPGFIRIWP